MKLLLYPIIFKPLYKEMIWGGKRLEELFGRELPSPHTGESWDITCRPNEMGIIANGEYAGKTFEELIKSDPEKVLGKSLYKENYFPLLVKLISAEDDLSVQVHPNDEYAKKQEDYGLGKSELWYILDAKEDSRIVLGLKEGVTKEIFEQALERGCATDTLEYLPVQKGDIINIPAGVLHALTKGIVVAEIQQNSDITYRVYDYNRIGLDGKPRQLHINKALDVIDFQGKEQKGKIEGYTVSKGENKFVYYISNECFTVIKYEIEDSHSESSDYNRFYIFTCAEGNCVVGSGDYSLRIKQGDTFFIPASLGEYNIKGKCTLLKSFVGDTNNDFEDRKRERNGAENERKAVDGLYRKSLSVYQIYI